MPIIKIAIDVFTILFLFVIIISLSGAVSCSAEKMTVQVRHRIPLAALEDPLLSSLYLQAFGASFPKSCKQTQAPTIRLIPVSSMAAINFSFGSEGKERQVS